MVQQTCGAKASARAHLRASSSITVAATHRRRTVEQTHSVRIGTATT